MRDEQGGRLALRWWESMRPAERIVAMSLIAGGVIGIINSTVWAAAVCYIERQRTMAAIARTHSAALAPAERPGEVAAIREPQAPWDMAGGGQ